MPAPVLTAALASHFAGLALRCARREYPNKPDHVINDASDLRSPRAMHPAFYGCYDWHSCVHGHWLLARLRRERPDLPEAAEIEKLFDEDLTSDNIAAEVRYLEEPERKSFERAYGWAWLLKLDEELRLAKDPKAARWEAALRPLALALAARYKAFFPRQTYAIRTGVHPNTAFALGFGLDWARAAGDKELEALIVERARTYYVADRDAPAGWEPGGEDFFSPALMEADLMRRVLPAKDFARWYGRFLPKLPKALSQPAVVSDRSDPKLVHLDGLNLSRAWAMRGIASALPAQSAARETLSAAAARHLGDALPHVGSGDYAGEHWLATFALYALSQEGPGAP